MKKKMWCVHVYERPRDQSVMASTANKAKSVVIDAFYAGSYDKVHDVEVMRECHCGTDNDRDATKCEECGAKL